MKLRIKKGDTVQVIAGADKGRKGEVLEVVVKNLKIRVSGVAEKTHFDKKDGIKKAEGLIDYSNVKLVESKAKEVKKSKSKSAAKK